MINYKRLISASILLLSLIHILLTRSLRFGSSFTNLFRFLNRDLSAHQSRDGIIIDLMYPVVKQIDRFPLKDQQRVFLLKMCIRDRYWLDNKLFRSKPDGREPYTVVIPPPNVTGVLHMGHMLNNTCLLYTSRCV